MTFISSKFQSAAILRQAVRERESTVRKNYHSVRPEFGVQRKFCPWCGMYIIGCLYSLVLDGFSADTQKDGVWKFEGSYLDVTAGKVQIPDFAQLRKAAKSNE